MNDYKPNNIEVDLAKKQSQLQKDVRLHLRIFLLTSMALFGANLFTNFHHPYNFWWSFSPILTWGIIVAIHKIINSFFPNILIKFNNWEAQKIQMFNKGKTSFINSTLTKETTLGLKKIEKIKHYEEEDLV